MFLQLHNQQNMENTLYDVTRPIYLTNYNEGITNEFQWITQQSTEKDT